MSILDLTAVQLGKKIKAKEVTVLEAVVAVLEQMKKMEPVVNAYVTVDEEGALKRAKEVQKMIDDGTLTGPLAGVPVAIKDNMCTKGMLTTCSSKILYNFVPTYTAQAVENLEKAGAVKALTEAESTPELIYDTAIGLLRDPAALKKMGENAHAKAQPDVLEHIYQTLRSL